jgi:adenylate cyclase
MTTATLADSSSVPAVAAVPPRLPTLDQALARDKREGLEIAVRARWITCAVLVPMMFYLNPSHEALYYVALIALFALTGWAHLKVGTVGRSRAELALLLCDVALLTFALVVPNPLRTELWPPPMQYRFGGIIYFFLLLSTAVLTYTWRTIAVLAVCVVVAWSAGILWAMSSVDHPELSLRVSEALPGLPEIAALLDPNTVNLPTRVQEMVIFLLIAATLAAASWRSHRLVHRQAEAERERSNLARYFSPNVVATLAHNDTPLRSIRSQNVAVLFVDIVGFTAFADRHEPVAVVRTLRDFLERMEREVFRHEGTLDKYLGDGLMATFGTPVAGDNDAVHALRAGRAMLAVVDDWNRERARRGEESLAIGVGLHYGPVVTGDIGANRLELAVVGATVNIASRLEAQTRVLNVRLVTSRDLVEKARSEPDWRRQDEDGLEAADPQVIRGIAEPVRTWVLGG